MNKYRKTNINKKYRTDTFVSVKFLFIEASCILLIIEHLEKSFDDFKIDFGKNLRSLRKIKSISSGDLALDSDLSSGAFVLSVERGEKDIQLSTIFKLAKGLGVEPKELLNFTTEPQNTEGN